MAGTKFDDIYKSLRDVDSIKDLKIINKKIPIGKKNKKVCYRNRKTIKLDLDLKGDISFFDDLPNNIDVQIGDTYYKKTGANFKYDYNHNSSDFAHNLTELLKDSEIYIMIDNGLRNEHC